MFLHTLRQARRSHAMLRPAPTFLQQRCFGSRYMEEPKENPMDKLFAY